MMKRQVKEAHIWVREVLKHSKKKTQILWTVQRDLKNEILKTSKTHFNSQEKHSITPSYYIRAEAMLTLLEDPISKQSRGDISFVLADININSFSVRDLRRTNQPKLVMHSFPN